MVSLRKIVRHTLRDRLIAAETSAGDRVETNRSSRVWRGRMPAIVIYTSNDPAENFDAAPLSYESTLRVAVELWTTKPDEEEADDALDDLIDEVEAELLPLIPSIVKAIGGNVEKSGYEGVEIDVDADGNRILAGARCTYRFVYYIEPSYEPPGGFVPLELARIDYDVPEGNDSPDATDDVTVPQ